MLSKIHIYDYFWIIEDDVYFNSDINKIFHSYKNNYSDLILSSWFKKKINNDSWYHWKKGYKYFSKQHLASSLNVFSRISKKLLIEINKFRHKHNTLIFHEILLSSLSIQNNLKIEKLNSKYKVYLEAGHTKSLHPKHHYKKYILFHPYKNWYSKLS